MLKYFNFSILLITLSIVSVTPIRNNIIRDENRMPASNVFDSFAGFGLSPFTSGFPPIKPMPFRKPLSKSLSFGDDIDNILNNIQLSLLKLKETLANASNGKNNMEEVHECCDSAGKCRDIKEGELCDGIEKSRFKMKIGPLVLPTSNKNSNSPKPSENELKSPETTDADDSEPTIKSDGDVHKSNGLSEMGENEMQSEEDQKNLDGVTEGGKRVGNSDMYYVMPPVKAPQKHSYEKPDGLTDAEVKAYRDEVLKQTNMYRKKHGLNPVTLNEDMNNHAQEWANILAPEQGLRHRTNNDNKIYGENLYYISDSLEHLGEEAVNAWYNELRFVRPDDDENRYINPRGVIGHLTQLLWKKSKQMGVGVAKNQYGGYVVVANYNPGGNVIPFYKENLPEFSQEDITAAQKAHETHEQKINTPRLVTFNSKSLSPLDRSSSIGNLPFGSSSFRSMPFGSSPFRSSSFGSSSLGSSPLGSLFGNGVRVF